jgi:hypothetical protein
MAGGMATAQRRRAVTRPRQPAAFNPPSIVQTWRPLQALSAFERMDEHTRPGHVASADPAVRRDEVRVTPARECEEEETILILVNWGEAWSSFWVFLRFPPHSRPTRAARG